MKTDTDCNHFENYRPLIEKIKGLLPPREMTEIKEDEINGEQTKNADA